MKTKTLKHFVASALCIAMIAGSLDIPILSQALDIGKKKVSAAEISVSTWQDLKTAVETSYASDTTIILGKNISAGYDDEKINVMAGCEVTIDLNDKEIDRGFTSAHSAVRYSG